MTFSCCKEERKAAVLGNSAINGIDYLEVLDHAAIAIPSLRQRTLFVNCINPAPTGLTPDNIVITGGESITGITAQWIAPATPAPPLATAVEAAYFAALANPANILVVRTSAWGDFSPYTLRLVNHAADSPEDVFQITDALTGFDPQLAEVTFSFKVECGPEFDCAPAAPDCPPELPTPPPINYLAKDYSSFRQVMLDRLNQLLPQWNATSEADMGVMLAELISYAGDQLSYRQDAVTTEAYLGTARSRISLRRHARLVDYFVHDGCNARAWVQINVKQKTFIDRSVTRFYTTASGMPASLEATAGNEEAALIAGVVAFEPMENAFLYPEQNAMNFYTWGDANCCLPQGSTQATLAGTFQNLQVGDVLIFQEVMGPQTGFAADADIRHRCAVRLTAVLTGDASGNPLVDPLFDIHGIAITSAGQTPQPVTEIQWSSDDALPLPVCVSSQIEVNGILQPLLNVSIVLGNVVLADQGLSVPTVTLGTVPQPTLQYPPNPSGDRCQPPVTQYFPVRFRPQIPDSPVTQAVTLPLAGSPVTSTATPLTANGWTSLPDTNGFVSLMVAADSPLTWPQYFGVLANVNAGNSSLLDLSVVFNPPGGPTGVTAPVVLEVFPGLSLTTTDANYAGKQLANSEFIKVPVSFMSTVAVPSAYPSSPIMLPNSGDFSLTDASAVPYLTIETRNPLAWPPLFAVLAQAELLSPDTFNLLLLYSPSSGAEGVALPAVVEQFNSVSLETLATTIDAASDLISVKTFEEEPNPSLSAFDLMNFDADQAVPAMTLTSMVPPSGLVTDWTAAPDLLASGADDPRFVMEVDTDGTAYLRFGDGVNGLMPESGSTFTASYRVGNGAAGNVGANSLTNFAAGILADSAILNCTNPLPATGGIDPETNAQIVRRAPRAFLTQERAITMRDYINVVEENPQIEDAAATLRWTGSWYTVFIAAEPVNNGALSKTLRRNLTQTVNEYRLAGQDVLIEPPQYVPLQIELTVCVAEDYFQRDVRQQLMQALGSGMLANGQPALFSPDNFELGQTVYLSPIYAAARNVAGVERVSAKVFEPQGENTKIYLQQGFIPMGAFQVARMANDPSLPANGRLTLKMKGGR
jgi:hypothetical protein